MVFTFIFTMYILTYKDFLKGRYVKQDRIVKKGGDKYHLRTMSMDGFISFNVTSNDVYMLGIWALNGSYSTQF